MPTEVQVREDLAKTFSVEIDAWADSVASSYSQQVEPHLLEGEILPDMALTMRLLGRAVMGHYETVLGCDRGKIDVNSENIIPREERDSAYESLREKMVEYRRLAEAAYGKKRSAKLIPIDGNTAVVPKVLFRQAEHTLQRLEDPSKVPPSVKVSGVTVDPSEWIVELQTLVTDLGVNLGLIKRTVSLASGKVAEKQEARKDFDFFYSHGRGILRGVFFLGGRPDLGKKLPTVNRRRRSLLGPDAEEKRPRTPEPEETEEPPENEGQDDQVQDDPSEPPESEPDDGESSDPESDEGTE